MNEIANPKTSYVYLGGLSPVNQGKFLQHYQEADKHGVTSDDFVKAWNSYAMSIEEHVFVTETPGTAKV
jgi:hypothetical protein